ncbi:hypothetical protein AG1IA_05750 [Rhizoctonia solani AG-1 IA]|uniref:Uncharacterized protein n=1 Tax=Thanatephorus cucumeris (strain AG1-IA) TaxID=983506 RepID=L8WTW0_THACA|nr:hypothetical protein AG1IA_05750 [Rhizoctonia solani AG-1 IA]
MTRLTPNVHINSRFLIRRFVSTPPRVVPQKFSRVDIEHKELRSSRVIVVRAYGK